MDCKDGSEDGKDGREEKDAAEDPAEPSFALAPGACASGICFDWVSSARLGTKLTLAAGACSGKRDCADRTDRWDPCEWWAPLPAACALLLQSSAMSFASLVGMLPKKSKTCVQDSSS